MSATPQTADIEFETRSPGLWELFIGFLGIGMIGFGGVLPLSRRMIVESRKWLSEAEFTDMLGLCQFLPGGTVINISVAVGMKFGGWRGALAAIGGLLAVPTCFVICLGLVYDRFRDNPEVVHVFAGLAAAAAGLLIAMGWKIARPLITKPHAIVIALVCFVLIAVLRLPLLIVLVVLAPISLLISWRMAR